MSLMDKILTTVIIWWFVSFVISLIMYAIGSMTEREEIVDASLYFIVGLIGIAFVTFCGYILVGLETTLQEMWEGM